MPQATQAPGATLISLEDHRHQREEQARHDADAATRQYNLARARELLARLGDTPELLDLPDSGPGACSDCHHETISRWTIGTVQTCRTCTHARLHARHDPPPPAEAAHPAGPNGPTWFQCLTHWVAVNAHDITEHNLRGKLKRENPLLTMDERRTLIRLHRKLRDRPRIPDRPADLHAWVHAHASRLTLTELERRLTAWHATPEERYALADLLADRRRQLGITEAA